MFRIFVKDELILSCGFMWIDKEIIMFFDYYFYFKDFLLCVIEIRLSNKINMIFYSDNSLMFG